MKELLHRSHVVKGLVTAALFTGTYSYVVEQVLRPIPPTISSSLNSRLDYVNGQMDKASSDLNDQQHTTGFGGIIFSMGQNNPQDALQRTVDSIPYMYDQSSLKFDLQILQTTIQDDITPPPTPQPTYNNWGSYSYSYNPSYMEPYFDAQEWISITRSDIILARPTKKK